MVGCSDGNSNATLDTQPHPQTWLTTHPDANPAAADFANCTSCHGPDLTGGGEAPSCFSCHVFNTGRVITIHPVNWANTYVDHSGTSEAIEATTCTVCHGANLNGSDPAPSCYSCHVFNSSPPLTTHPPDWSEPLADHSGSVDATTCTTCHGAALQGFESAPSCYSCHDFNADQTFTIHPVDWTNPFADHRVTTDTTTCTACHGADLLGSAAAPSCFSSATADGSLRCHANGPGVTPHPLDGTYLDGALHGLDAKADLLVCHACHAEPTGPGTNPRFNGGIESQGGNGCESCHGIYYAHPVDWDGYGPTAHQTAGNIANACILCHGLNLDGGIGVSCKKCHPYSL